VQLVLVWDKQNVNKSRWLMVVGGILKPF